MNDAGMRTDFASTAELQAHYRGVHDRLWNAPKLGSVNTGENYEKIIADLRLEIKHLEAKLAEQVALNCRIAEISDTRDQDKPVARRIPSIALIKQTVADEYKLRFIELSSHSRFAHVVLPRQVAIYLAFKLTGGSSTTIGAYFGGRDHTTVLHSNKKIEARRKADSEFAALLLRLAEKLTGAADALDR